ncbi:MAG: type II toxin-antitoxin system VapC family toxin [Acidiferrobacterales bacterium]
MVVLDTSAIVFDALQPTRLSRNARSLLEQAHAQDDLACCDISLWEIAMLVSKGRLDTGVPALEFIKLAIVARSICVLGINPEIADLSVSFDDTLGSDPADRLVAATAVFHRATLITTDGDLSRAGLPIKVIN